MMDDLPTGDMPDPDAIRIALAALKAFRRTCNDAANVPLLKLGYRKRQCLWPPTSTDVRIMDKLAEQLAQKGVRIADWVKNEALAFARESLNGSCITVRAALSTSSFHKWSVARLSEMKRHGSAGKLMQHMQWETPLADLTLTSRDTQTKTRRTP